MSDQNLDDRLFTPASGGPPWTTGPSSGSKYLRRIRPVSQAGAEVVVDVYAVLDAYAVTCPARAHAVKKLLCAGLRGKGTLQDLKETAEAVGRAIQMEKFRETAREAQLAQEQKPPDVRPGPATVTTPGGVFNCPRPEDGIADH